MQKVRIGNDIRLNLTLRGPRNFDEKSIKELRCYFINTSVTRCFGDRCIESCCRKRYPWDCFPCHHNASSYLTNTCGRPCYHTYPHCFVGGCCGHCCHHTKYPQSPCDPAHGMGPLPPKYDCDCCHYCRHGHHNPLSRCYDCWDSLKFNHCFYRPGHDDLVTPHLDEDFRYLAPSRVLPQKNKIQTYFPAADQFMCGVYKLVVVMVAYEAGWGRCDLHTYTIDYGQVVTLVDDNTGIDGDVTIDVDNGSTIDGSISQISTTRDTYYMTPLDTLSIGGYDYYDKQYTVNVLVGGSSTPIEYDPMDWPYDELKFESADPTIVAVDPHTGRLTAMDNETNAETVITVTSADTTYSFTVKVIGSGYDYIGFSASTDYRQVRLELPSFKKARSIYGTHELKNMIPDGYLWIVSREPIADMNSLEETGRVRISTFDAPLQKMAEPSQDDNHYYYYCPNKVMTDKAFDITVDKN